MSWYYLYSKEYAKAAKTAEKAIHTFDMHPLGKGLLVTAAAFSYIYLNRDCRKKNTWTDDGAVIQFQDEKFLQAILENPRNTVDKNNDGQISEKEARKATVLDVSLAGISSMEEIKYFTSLTELYCWANQLTTLDVSRNTLLEFFGCCYNSIASLDVSRNASLQVLDCSNNILEYMDVSANPALTNLSISSNRIPEINFYTNRALVELYCNDNLLTSLDLRNNKELEQLFCSGNQLNKLILYRHHKLPDGTIAEIREEYGDIIDYEFARP